MSFRSSPKFTRKRLRTNPRPHGWVAPARAELKYNDALVSNGIAAATAAGDVHALHVGGVATGSAADERIGRCINVKSIEVVFRLDRTSGRTPTVDNAGDFQVRLYVFKDKFTNGSQMALADAISGVALSGFKNLENRFRFETLYERLLDFNIEAMSYDGTDDDMWIGGVSKFFKVRIPVNDRVTYSGATAGIGDSSDVSYHVFISHGFVRQQFNYIITSRIRFTDM